MKKFLKILMVIALIAFVTPSICYAETTKVDYDLFKADYSITVNEDMEGSGFIAGNEVNINNKVNGILFAAGNIINASNTSDYVFSAGSVLTFNDSTFKDGFFAGSIIDLNNVNIERDLYAAGQKITLTGSAGRNVFIAGDSVVIDGVINNNLYVDASSIVINSNAKINGQLKYNSDADITISKDAVIGTKSTYKNTTRSSSIDVNTITTTTIINKLIDTLTNLLNMLVVGLLMVLLIPNLFKKLREIEANRLLPSFAWGLLILFTVPMVAVLAMITYVGVATGIIAGAIYGILLYVSTIFSTYVIISLILKDKVKNPYLVLLIGLPCLYIIKLIPFLGGLVSFAVLCLGFGLLTNLIKRK